MFVRASAARWTPLVGVLAAGAAVIGGLGGNIIDVVHNRLALDVPAKGAEFDIMVERLAETYQHVEQSYQMGIAEMASRLSDFGE